MVDIKCLVCGESLEIPPYIDTEKYDGQVSCQACGSLLHIKLTGSKVQGYKLVEKSSRKREKMEKLIEELRRAGKQPDDK